MSNTLLTLKGISKSYKQGSSTIKILHDINFSVNYNEMVAITGVSGSGKSTLLHISGLLDAADSGKICIDSLSNYRVNNLEYASHIRLNHIGFIYQYHHLLKDFTAQENVAIPLLINKTQRKEAMEKAESILDRLGLKKRLGSVIGELSGGERQRVAVARALINNPKIILADEPTGNLDYDTSNQVIEIFFNYLRNKKDAAIIMVSHNLELAGRMNRVYRLDKGKLAKVQ